MGQSARQRLGIRIPDQRVGTLWEPVEATPEQIALACMQEPPKKKWDYLSKGEKPPEDGESEAGV